jgi:hypothetical protein
MNATAPKRTPRIMIFPGCSTPSRHHKRVPEGPAWSGRLPDELTLHRKVVKIEQFTGYSADFRTVLLRRHALEMRADQQIADRKKPGRALRTRPGRLRRSLSSREGGEAFRPQCAVVLEPPISVAVSRLSSNVIGGKADIAQPSFHVRFPPKATEIVRCREMTRMGWTGRAPAANGFR